MPIRNNEEYLANKVSRVYKSAFEETYDGSFAQYMNEALIQPPDPDAPRMEGPPPLAVRVLLAYKCHMKTMEGLGLFPLFEEDSGAAFQMYERAEANLELAIKWLDSIRTAEEWTEHMNQIWSMVDAFRVGKGSISNAPEFVFRIPSPEEGKRQKTYKRAEDAGASSSSTAAPFATGMQAAAAGRRFQAREPAFEGVAPNEQLRPPAMGSLDSLKSQLKCVWRIADVNMIGSATTGVLKEAGYLVIAWAITGYGQTDWEVSKAGEVFPGLARMFSTDPRVRELLNAVQQTERLENLKKNTPFQGQGVKSVMDDKVRLLWDGGLTMLERLGFVQNASDFQLTNQTMAGAAEIRRSSQQGAIGQITRDMLKNPDLYWLADVVGRTTRSASAKYVVVKEYVQGWIPESMAQFMGTFFSAQKLAFAGYGLYRFWFLLRAYTQWFHGTYTNMRREDFLLTNDEPLFRRRKDQLQRRVRHMKEYFRAFYYQNHQQELVRINAILDRKVGVNYAGEIQTTFTEYLHNRNQGTNEQKVIVANRFIHEMDVHEEQINRIPPNANLEIPAGAAAQHANHEENFEKWCEGYYNYGRQLDFYPPQGPAVPRAQDPALPVAYGVAVQPAPQAPAPVVQAQQVPAAPVQPPVPPPPGAADAGAAAQAAGAAAAAGVRRGGRARRAPARLGAQVIAVDAHGSVVNHIFFKRYGL